MKRFDALTAVIILASCAALAPAGDEKKDKKDKDKPKDTVVRYVGAKRGVVRGRPVLVLVVGPRQGSGAANLVVPNKDPMGKTFDPPDHVVKLVKELKRGDLLDVQTGKWMGHNMIQKIARHKSAPGEDDPNCFTFVKIVDRKVGQRIDKGVALTKFDKGQVVMIPSAKGDDGKPIPDAGLLAKAEQFKEGDLVEVKIRKDREGVMLVDIKAYVPVEKGVFVKLLIRKIDGADRLAAQIKVGRHTRTLLVPQTTDAKGKSGPDPKMRAALKALEYDQPVTFKARKEGKYEVFLELAPDTDAKKPAKKPAKAPADQPEADG